MANIIRTVRADIEMPQSPAEKERETEQEIARDKELNNPLFA